MFSLFMFLLSPSFILIASAIIPAIVLLVYIYRQDKLEKESWGLLGRLVLLGAVSTFLAQITESVGIALLGILCRPGGRVYNILLYFIVVGLSEEGFKYLVLKKRTWYSPEFDCRFDGVVYAAAVSLGFALWENISYVISYGFSTALVRAVTAVPGHACFGVFMGAFYGAAKKLEASGDALSSKECRTLAIIVPVLLHGAYDFIASGSSSKGEWLFLAFIAAMFFFAYRTVKKLSENDRYI